MPRRTYEYEATIKIKVRVDDDLGARAAGAIARSVMLDVREVEYDDLYGSAKISGGSPKRVNPA